MAEMAHLFVRCAPDPGGDAFSLKLSMDGQGFEKVNVVWCYVVLRYPLRDRPSQSRIMRQLLALCSVPLGGLGGCGTQLQHSLFVFRDVHTSTCH